MSDKTGFDLWTPNDYSNFITICAAAIGSTLLVIFKSRCVKVTLCCGLWSCDRQLAESDSDSETGETGETGKDPKQSKGKNNIKDDIINP
tara:strand:- start:461 stop:730 length:270 start_codon:yes stop_codon:yes gene_type:complete